MRRVFLFVYCTLLLLTLDRDGVQAMDEQLGTLDEDFYTWWQRKAYDQRTSH